MAPTIIERLTNPFLPLVLIVASIVFLLQTAITSPNILITDFKSYRDRAFARFWLAFGKKLSEDMPLEVNSILAESHGVVMDVGPGTGYQVFRFSQPKNITMIYGVEPGVEMHGELLEHAKRAGLGGKYKILSCGAEPESLIPALIKESQLNGEKGLRYGMFDEVICIRVLCGVPRLEETVENLYRCLKPGGRFVVCEHVISDVGTGGSHLTKLLQQFYMAIGWPYLLGGCELTRDTSAVLMKAAEADGGWADVKLNPVNGWSIVPHVVGYCTKKR